MQADAKPCTAPHTLIFSGDLPCTLHLKNYNLLSQVDSAYHDAALKLGLTDSELDILYSLNEHGSGCNQSIFYKETGTTKSTINSAVRRMEQAGYLYLKPGTGRNTCVFLTEKGEELMKNTAHRLIAIENAIFESWSPEEQQLFMKLNRDFAAKFMEETKTL